MRLAINLHGKYLFIDPAKASAVIEAIVCVALYEKKGWGGTTSAEYTPAADDAAPEVFYVTDKQLLPAEAPIKKLTDDNARLSTQWYEQYTQTQNATARVKELEAQLAAIRGAVAPEEV